jgi:PST family polysaccharide transporter
VLRYYLWAGISIGIFSPLSMFVARGLLSSSLSWHEVGQLQALWRSSEWVSGIAAGVMSVYFLPRMSAAVDSAAFVEEVRACAWWTLVPSGIALAALYVLRKPVFEVLYDTALLPGDESVLVFLAGTWVRIASWVPLFALYALRRTAAVTYGELLSLPLFAAGLALFAEGMTLERASFLWLAAYLVYALFNLVAIQPRPRAAR